MDKNEFVEKFCKNCKASCDRGMIVRSNFIRCIDREIYVEKKAIENKK